MLITQENIDEAVLIGKSAAATLAFELATEARYGGNIDCCFRKLELIWSWVDALVCEKRDTEAVLAKGSVEITNANSSANTIEIFVNGFSISGVFNVIAGTTTQNMTALVAQINDYQDKYEALLITSGKTYIQITGTCENEPLTYRIVATTNPTLITATSLWGGVCPSKANVCLSDEQIQSLIRKIKGLCTQ